MLTLFGYNISPYAAKVRAVLRYKGVPFEERMVHPLERGEVVRRSRQNAIPIVDDDGTVVADSTRIVEFLDRRYPARPVIPTDPALRARALLLEEGFDEGLARTIQPVRWMIPANARRTAARFRSAYPPGLFDDIRMALVSATLRSTRAGSTAAERLGRRRRPRCWRASARSSTSSTRRSPRAVGSSAARRRWRTLRFMAGWRSSSISTAGTRCNRVSASPA